MNRCGYRSASAEVRAPSPCGTSCEVRRGRGVFLMRQRSEPCIIEGLVDDSIVMSQSPVSAAEYEKQNELETREQDLEKLPAQRRNRGQWNTKRYEPEQLVHDDVDDDDDGLGEDDPPQGRGPSQPAISGFFGAVTAVAASVGLSQGEDSRTSSNADGQPTADVVGSGADDSPFEHRTHVFVEHDHHHLDAVVLVKF